MLGVFVGREIRQQKLQNDGAIEVEVNGLVDRAHAALAELFGDLEVGDLSADHGGSPKPPGSLERVKYQPGRAIVTRGSVRSRI